MTSGLPATCPVSDVSVGGLELRADLLASQSAFSAVDYGFGTSAVGILDVRTGHRTTQDSVTAGVNGQSHVAPAFLDRRTLAWSYTCFAEPDGCDAGGILREDLRTGRRTRLPLDPTPSGWAPLGASQLLLSTEGTIVAQPVPRAVAARQRKAATS